MRIALDMEEVLANTHAPMLAAYNERHDTNYTYTQMDRWEWVEEEIEYAEFDTIVHGLWEATTDHPDAIEPCEPFLDYTVERLAGMGTLDIVTARQGVEAEMEAWLATQDITAYDTFTSVDPATSKGELGYDVYIDDKPGLAEHLADASIQLMPMRPWNRAANDHPQVVPVAAVAEAVWIPYAARFVGLARDVWGEEGA